MWKVALAVLGCVAVPAFATAASGRVASLNERIQGADSVVVATVTDVNANWKQNEHGDFLIVSRVGLQVEETLKGSANSAVAMDLEGGTVQGITLRVSDLPQLAPGEKAVFFLDKGAAGTRVPHLRGQGILKLDDAGLVKGSSLSVDDIRRSARGLGK